MAYRHKLRINKVLGTKGRMVGKPIRRAMAGTVIRIQGDGFGKDIRKVKVLFDDLSVSPLQVPFSNKELFVICPLPAKPTSELRVRVGSRNSNQIKFRVFRPRKKRREVGAITSDFFNTLDQYAAMLADITRKVSPGLASKDALLQAADSLDDMRKLNQRNVELLMTWKDVQASVPFEPLKTIERLDEHIENGGLTGQVAQMIESGFGPGGWAAKFFKDPVDMGKILFKRAGALPAQTLLSSGIFGLSGSDLHEGSKILEGIENIFKIVVPSLSTDLGGEVGIVIAGINFSIGADVDFSIGEGISAIAKLVDFIGQQFIQIDDEAFRTEVLYALRRIERSTERLEIKADREEGLIQELSEGVGQLEAKLDTQNEKLDALEMKDDLLEQKLDAMEEKSDRQTELLGILEQKADRQEEKLDVLEMKADTSEGKLDIIELKNDSQEVKLDKLEEKADKQEEKLDRLEEKSDKQEEKLDRLEGKTDELEEKNDRQEDKLDRLEEKADRHELKLDHLEEKTDRLEEKLDRIEEKQDREEEKLDRLPLPAPPLEGSVANQRGGSDNVTSAVAAIRIVDNQVYLRAAIDKEANELDNENAWSQWISMGRPNIVFALMSVSLDLQYEEGSNTILNAILSARDQSGKIYHRVFESLDHQLLIQADRWSDWEDFLTQP